MTATTSSTVNSTSFANFILAELACAAARTRLLTTEIDSIGVALTGNFITTDDAIAWLDEAGGLDLIAVSSAIILASTT
jgi:hypothetical protein